MSKLSRKIKLLEDIVTECRDCDKPVPSYIYDELDELYAINNNEIPDTTVHPMDELEQGLGSPYIPTSQGPRLNVEVPDKMSDETHEMLDRIDDEVGGIDKFVMKKLGFASLQQMYINPETYKGLSAEQIDAVALAIYNIEQKKQFVIVSDQTGIGKGRIAAAIMRYAHRIGKKPLFLTIRPNLFTDIYRDLEDIYLDDMVPIKVAERDEDGNVLERISTRTDKETGEVKEYRTAIYTSVKKPKFGRRFVPFIVNEKGSEDPSIKTKDGDIAYTVPSGEERASQIRNVMENGNYAGFDCFLCTYSQIVGYKPEKPIDLLDVEKRDANNEPLTVSSENKKIDGMNAVLWRRINWLRRVMRDNIVIMDESHEAAGDGNTVSEFFNRVFTYKNIWTPLGGLFLSATYAKTPKNMPLYAWTTSIRKAKLASQDFVKAVQNGGNALQELLSSQLVTSGCLIRRERPLQNLTFNMITFDIIGKQLFGVEDKEYEYNAMFDNMTAALRDIIAFQIRHVFPLIELRQRTSSATEEVTGGVKKVTALSYKADPIFNKLFQIVNQSVFALKAHAAADRAIARMKEGMKPVITFQNTMDTWLEEIIQTESANNANVDFGVVIRKGLETCMVYYRTTTISTTVEQYDPTTGETKEVTSEERVTIQEIINPETDLSKTGQDDYADLVNRIKKFSMGISVSPIDVIKKRITDAGYSVGEITGRKFEVQFTDNSYSKGNVIIRRKEKTNDTVYKFQTNKIDCVLLNEAGSTGISLHATRRGDVDIVQPFPPKSLKNSREVKKRVMIVCQPNLEINKMVQTWGRVNRSGQVYKPEYDILSLAVPAEKRLMLFLQRKLRSLDSNTSSNQKQNEAVINVDDFLNKYGDEIVATWLTENNELDIQMGEPLWKKSNFRVDSSGFDTREITRPDGSKYEEYYDPTNAAQIVSGRAALLTTANQKRFYDEVTEKFIEYVNKLKREGKYDLEMLFVPLNATTLDKKVAIYGDIEKNNPFSTDTILERCEVDNLNKPYTKDEVANLVLQSLDGKSPEEYKENWVLEMKEFYNARQKRDVEKIRQKYDGIIADIPTKPKIKRIKEEQGDEAAKIEIQKLVSLADAEKVEETASAMKEATDMINLYTNLSIIMMPGYGFKISDPNNVMNVIEYFKGVFIGISFGKNTNNPYTPSNLTLRFAITSGGKTFEMTPTKANLGHLWNTWTEAKAHPLPNKKTFVDEWEKETENVTARTIRYIITGNILQSYRYSEYSGSLVSFTTNDGRIRKGVLLPSSFNASPHANMLNAVPIVYCKKLFDNLTRRTELFSSARTHDEALKTGVIWEKEWDGNFIMSVPGNAKDGAMYYKNEKLISLLEKPYIGFQRRFDRYIGTIEKERIADVLNYLFYDLGSGKNDVGMMYLNEAQMQIIADDIPSRKTDADENEENEKQKNAILIKFEVKFFKMKQSYSNVAGVDGLSLTKQEKEALKRLNKRYASTLHGVYENPPTNKQLSEQAKRHGLDLNSLNI